MFNFSKENNLNLAKVYKKAENLINSVPIIKRRRRWRYLFNFFKYFSYAILALILIFIILGGNSWLNLYRAYTSALAGRDNLKVAIELAQGKEFKKALSQAEMSENNFNLASSKLVLAQNNFFIAKTPILNSQLRDIEYLLKSAEVLSRTIDQASSIGQEIDNILADKPYFKFSQLSAKQKEEILKLIYESGPELNGLKANLDLIYYNLNSIRYGLLLTPFKDKIELLKDELNQGRRRLDNILPLMQILPTLAGYPSKTNFLVMLQNNDELRPSGGFLGTYGLLTMKDGEIIRFDTHDIYHLDMPVKDKFNVSPPAPIKKYLVDKWYLRDANWSPDWPTSAEKIIWFYAKENALLSAVNKINNFSGEFDGVIALTPEVVSDLLAIVGPIIVDGTEYNQDNFQEVLQYKVEKEYIQLGVPAWQRKEVIGDIFKKLKEEMFNLPFNNWLAVKDALVENLLQKNILVYLSDGQLEARAKDLGWAGEIKDTNGDYLMVVDANLGALKTDAVMSKNINYKLEQTTSGFLAKLRINYAHNGDFDWRTTRYRTYTRIYVPLGSKLIKAKSDNGKNEEIDVKIESGKTSFGTWLIIEPGEVKSLYFEYRLPINLTPSADDYSLYIQKQPGNDVDSLVVDLGFKNEVKSYNPTGFSSERLDHSRMRWETDLNTDKMFEIKL